MVLEGKTLYIIPQGRSRDEGTLMTGTRSMTLLDRRFIVGRILPGTSTKGWIDGKEVAIAWDSVTEIVEIESG